jgi:hypothetical protein
MATLYMFTKDTVTLNCGRFDSNRPKSYTALAAAREIWHNTIKVHLQVCETHIEIQKIGSNQIEKR